MLPTVEQLRDALFSDDPARGQVAIHHIEAARPEMLPLLMELPREGEPVEGRDYTPYHAASMVRTVKELDEYLGLPPLIRERWLRGDAEYRDPIDTLCRDLPPASRQAREAALRAEAARAGSGNVLSRRLADPLPEVRLIEEPANAPARNRVRAGPNEPCPCGRKFKKCCMNKPAAL